MSDYDDIVKKRDKLVTQESSFVRAWYDPETRGYRFYLPSGEEIKPGLNASVTINDNWNAGLYDFHSATINVLVKIVNEKPK